MSASHVVARRLEKRAGYYSPELNSIAFRLEQSVDWLAFRKPGEAPMWTDAIKRIGKGAGVFVNGGAHGNILPAVSR